MLGTFSLMNSNARKMKVTSPREMSMAVVGRNHAANAIPNPADKCHERLLIMLRIGNTFFLLRIVIIHLLVKSSMD